MFWLVVSVVAARVVWCTEQDGSRVGEAPASGSSWTDEKETSSAGSSRSDAVVASFGSTAASRPSCSRRSELEPS